MKLYGNAIIVSPKLNRENPAAIKSFLAAFTKGAKEVSVNPAAAIADVKARGGIINAELETRRLKLAIDSVINSPNARAEGFGQVIVVGVLLGFLVGSSRLAYAAVYPLMTAFNALPKAAFVPILVVWFGIGIGIGIGARPAILTAFLISFFPIMVNIATGLATLEPELEDVLRVLSAKRWDVLVKVGLPRSMPYFYGLLKVAITLAFVGTTVSEMTAANGGIGYLLISAGSAMQMALAFAGLMVVGAMAMVMYELFNFIEKHTTGWAHRGSQS